MGCDAYHLGSMVVSMFSGVAMTPLLLMTLGDDFHWKQWTGTYHEVLPNLRAAFAEAVEYVEREVPDSCRTEVTEIVRQLCDPDPNLRGHPKNRREAARSCSLERYVTQFDLLAKRAELTMVTSLRPN